MTLYYDPQKRTTKPWIIFLLVCVPILLIVAVFVIGKQMASHKSVGPTKEVDIFAQ